MRRTRTTKLNVERLEDRSLMAGNVTATLVADSGGNSLYIDGDNAENRFTVESLGTNKVQVRGFNDSSGIATSINNGANALRTFTNVTNGIFIHTKGGNDLVRVTNLSIRGGLLVDLGSGNDEAVIGQDQPGGNTRFANTGTGPLFVGTNLKVVGGFGNDLLYASDAHTTLNGTIEMGNGNDIVRMRRPTGTGQNVEFSGTATIRPGFGNDTVDLLGLIVQSTLTIDDTVGFSNSFGNSLNLTLNAVDTHANTDILLDDATDSVNISNMHAFSTLQIFTGFGNDTIRFGGIAKTLLANFGEGSNALYLLNANIDTIFASGNGDSDLFDVRSTTSLNATFDGGFGTDFFVTSASQPNKITNLKKTSIP